MDWAPDRFSAFAGKAKLDATVMQSQTNPITDKLNLKADIQKFYQWVKDLSADPRAGGIPRQYVKDVQLLLNTFFPAGQTPSKEMVLRIRDQEYPRNTGQRGATPMQAALGTSLYPLEITDAASALGFIFSVVKPTVSNPTWETYYLPLLAVYSRCLYLAFIANHKVRDPMATSLGDVPLVSCAMYVGSDAKPQRFFYGCTAPSMACNIGDYQVERESQRVMLDTWRREHILNKALSQVPRSPSESLPTIPKFSPHYVTQLQNELFRDLRATPALSTACETLWTTLVAEFTAMYLEGPPEKTIPPIPLPLARIKPHKTLGPALGQLLGALVVLRFDNDDYSPLATKVITAFKAILKHYLTPHMYEPTDTTFTTEIQAPEEFGAVRDTALEAWWAAGSSLAFEVLETLYARHRQNNFREARPFGRCAETYCVTSLLPNYFPWLGQTGASMSDVRGICMNVHDVGFSLCFQQTFTSGDLAKATERGPYLLPCANCRVLLPLYKLDVSDDAYNKDILTLGPQDLA